MHRVTLVLAVMLCACGDPTVEETEPNNERPGATQVGASGSYVVNGSCASSNDLDYYTATARAGTFTARLEWEGSARLMFDPELNLSGSQITATSPLSFSGNTAAGSVLWAIDCGTDSPTEGLRYTLHVTIP